MIRAHGDTQVCFGILVLHCGALQLLSGIGAFLVLTASPHQSVSSPGSQVPGLSLVLLHTAAFFPETWQQTGLTLTTVLLHIAEVLKMTIALMTFLMTSWCKLQGLHTMQGITTQPARPGSRRHQYIIQGLLIISMQISAHGTETVDARVAGDIIDPAEALLRCYNFQLWKGAKQDDRHGICARLERQQLTRKRALQRATRRAALEGGTWYRNRWVTCRDIGLPGTPHDVGHHAQTRVLRQCMPKMLARWPPLKGPRMPKQGLGVLSSNLGGFSKAGYDEFQRWLHLDTTRQAVHVVFLQETWQGSTEFGTKDWIWIQSGRSPVSGQGVAVLLNRRFADGASVRYTERRVGRVLMVLVPALCGHPLRRRPTTLMCVYQHSRSSEQAEVYENRAKIWALLHQVMAAVPRRHLLLSAKA